MLLAATPSPQPVATDEAVAALARILDRSEADLGDPDACVRALIEAGIRPPCGDLLDIRIAAHNLRAVRRWRDRALGRAPRLALTCAVLAALMLPTIPVPVLAAEPLPANPGWDWFGALAMVIAVSGIIWAITDLSRRS